MAPGLQSARTGHRVLQLLDDSEEQEEEQEEQEEEQRQVDQQVEFPLHAAAAAGFPVKGKRSLRALCAGHLLEQPNFNQAA